MANIIKKARPNGWAIRLTEYSGAFYIEEADDCGYMEEIGDYDTLAEAEAAFAERVAILAKTPNWELQARYDEAHGTDNGYPRWQINEEY